MFPGLALSRAFGDLIAKGAGLSAVPDVESIEIQGENPTSLRIPNHVCALARILYPEFVCALIEKS
jgi:hypothetical protein